LKKEAGSGSKLGSIRLFEQPEAEAFFIKHGAGMRKRLNFCGSGSTLKKKVGSGSKKYSTASKSLFLTNLLFFCILFILGWEGGFGLPA